MARGAPFTDAERQTIIAAYAAGRSVPSIAAQLGRSIYGTRSVLVKAGVKLRPPGRPGYDPAPYVAAYEGGLSVAGVARATGTSENRVWHILHRAGVAMRPAGWPKDARKAAA